MSRVIDEATKNRMVEATDRFRETVMELRQELEDEINDIGGRGFAVSISLEFGVMENPDGVDGVVIFETQARSNLNAPLRTERKVTALVPMFGNPDVVH